jgi:hypothetical protein
VRQNCYLFAHPILRSTLFATCFPDMATARDFGDPEKKTSPVNSEQDVEQGTVFDKRHSVNAEGRKFSLTGRKSSVAESIIAADLLDERYATTQRGLKSRHAQMIALGGTIGTG